MIHRLIISFVVIALLAPISSSQHRSSFKPAYKLKDVTEFGCCGIDLELSFLIEALGKEPEARAHIIGYSGLDDPPGKLFRHLRYIENNLPDFMGDYSHPVSVENGGHRDKFTIEMWIVPKGASVPIPGRSTAQTDRATRLPYKFDEAEALIMEYKNKSSLQFGLACTLSFPDWAEFHRVLRDKPGQRGHIIIYVGYDDPVGHEHRIEKFLRAYLKKDYGEGFKELTMSYGGKREWSQIEIWLVPREETDHVPTPRAKSARAR